MFLFRKTVTLFFLLALVSVGAAARQLTQTDMDLSDLETQISNEVNQQVNSAMESMKEKCGPEANSLIGSTCYAACKGSLSIDGSTCTCNGKPCVSWKVGETAPTTISSETTSEPTQVTTQTSSGKVASIAFVGAVGSFFALIS